MIRNIKSGLVGLFICICIGMLWIDPSWYQHVNTHAELPTKAKLSITQSVSREQPNHHTQKVVSPVNDQPSSYKYSPSQRHHLSHEKAVEVIATGYSAGIESTGKTPQHPAYGITYSGLEAVRDESKISTIAADPKLFPLGTLLFIPGYGYGVVADIGSAIKGEKIDLYFDSKDQVYQEWGKRKLHVYVIRKGHGKVTKQLWEQIKNDVLASALPASSQIKK